ncbi:ferric reductase NAD binding domain-containing protein [Gloeopeniophorella convolvens]|nr:ferric reductase NAD binding domain-containing protein [Gloeopeniophorella convolvens]
MTLYSPSPISERATSAADRLLKNRLQRQYVKDFWICMGSVLAFLAAIRLAKVLLSVRHKRDRPSPTEDEKKTPLEVAEPSNTRRISWRRIPVAFATLFRIVAFRWTVPIGLKSVMSISELTFIAGYITTMFVFLFVRTHDLNYVFYEDRAVHLAASNLSLVVALAGKNNIISFVTGVGHEKLNVLHRAAARTCLILLWIHAGTRLHVGLSQNSNFSHGYIQWGLAGLIAFTMATVLSIRPIRTLAFEFFLVSHIFLIAIFLIGAVIHTRKVEFDDYVWPALVLWAFDRFLRFARLIWNSSLWRGVSQDHAKATVELLSEDTVRLTLKRRFNWRPGQHAYVILPTVSTLPTEAHPFTIASIPGNLDGSKAEAEKDVVFLIRGRGGFTQRLREFATQKGICSVPAFLDGPYGCPPDLRPFSTCILIAGGSGVSYTLPLLLESIRAANSDESSTKRVIFVWSVRHEDHLRWISMLLEDALSKAPPSLSIETRIYVTSGLSGGDVPTINYRKSSAESVDASVESPIKEEKSELPSYSALKITSGRPSIRRLLSDEIPVSEGPVSVDVAGPSGIANSVREALRSRGTGPMAVLRGAPSVTLHVETFGMVKG